MAYIDLRIVFDAEVDEFDEDYTHYQFSAVQCTGSDIDVEERYGITEILAQSDRWYDDYMSLILEAMGG